MQITLKYAGRCTQCGENIPSGVQAEWERGVGVRHNFNCSTSSSLTYRLRHDAQHQRDEEKKVRVTMGVFRKNGKIFVVKPNRERTFLYAKEVVPSPPRMTEAGEVVDFTTVYRAGAIFDLTESDRWPLKEAREFLTKFARCIVCGRHLGRAESVARSIGPICAGYFA